MKIGIIIASDDAETCWVALRYATFHLMQHKEVRVFFVDSGIKYQQITLGKFNILDGAEKFKQAGGLIYVCENREKLKEYLRKYFVPMVPYEDVLNISYDDNFRSIKTGNVYIREFKKVC